MIAECLIAGVSLVGCVGCWAAVQKHRIVAEMQKDKLKHDLEVLKPTPEPLPPPKNEKPSPAQQALTQLLKRRDALEAHINEMRNRVIGYSDKSYTQWRVDALKALEDAREEQKELVLEEIGLLEMMQTTRARVKIDNEQEREEDELVEQEEENEGQA
jgi:hypothetical protein